MKQDHRQNEDEDYGWKGHDGNFVYLVDPFMPSWPIHKNLLSGK